MSANKRKGTAAESAVRDYLAAELADVDGVDPRRVAQTGALDTGDIHGVDPFVLQVKAWKDIAGALREGLAGAVVQAERAGRPYGAAVIKRPRKPISDAAVVLRLSDFARLLRELHSGR